MDEITNKGQIHELNWIRGLSALCIVFYHYTTQYQSTIGHLTDWPVMVPWGCGAVNLFFLLSGFLTIYTLKLGSSPFQFAWKRAKRLYPTYWFCILLTSIAMIVLFPEYLRGTKEILINFTMLQNFIGVTNVDGVYWTLSYELIFYFYVAVLLLFKMATWKWIRNLALVWVVVSFVYFGLESIGYTNLALNICRLTLMPYFSAPFAGGMLLAFVAKEGKRDFIAYGGVLASLALSFTVQELSYAVMYVIGVVFILMIVEQRFVSNCKAYIIWIEKLERYAKPISFIATISYPLYLLHQYIGFAIIKNLEMIGITSEAIIIVPFGLLVIIAFLVHKIVGIVTSRAIIWIKS